MEYGDFPSEREDMYRTFFSILLVFVYAATGLAANEKIVVMAFEYPPIYQNDKDKGLSGDIVVEAFKAVNIDVEMQFYPVSRMVRNVSSGQAVCGIGGAILFAAPDVAANVTVSSVIQFVSQTFLYDVRKYPAGITFANLADMSRYRIGVLNGSGIMKLLEKTKELKLDTNTTHDGTAKQLQIGRVDVWAIVDLTGIMYMKKLFPEEATNYKFTKSFNLGDVSVVFSRQMDPNNVYNDKFKEGLAAIKKNGTYMQIMARYYGSKTAINMEALTEDMR
jgi:ABC-type amino acid transport substrate-binding protein